MTTLDVRRATIVLCALFLTAAAAFAVMAGRTAPVPAPPAAVSPAEPEGARIFASRCAACHQAWEIAQLIRDAPDRPARKNAIASLLSSHGDASADEADAILAYLDDLAGG